VAPAAVRAGIPFGDVVVDERDDGLERGLFEQRGLGAEV
jgi:hypothetical protein